MIRKPDAQIVEMKCIRSGVGETEMKKLLNGADEMYGKGRMFNLMTVQPGTIIPMKAIMRSSIFFPDAESIMTTARKLWSGPGTLRYAATERPTAS